MVQDDATCTEVYRMDKPVEKMLANEDLLCVLTSGGVITVFRRTLTDEDGKPITVLNVVRIYHNKMPFNFSLILFFLCAAKKGENERESEYNSTDLVE